MSRGAQSDPQLSLAIIVRNDLSRLERTLAAVASSVDEVVVCDTGEEEGVAALVGKYGGRCIEQPWCDSFAFARNECLRHVRGQWILWLDAGETMDAADLQQLREYLSVNPTPAGYFLLIKTPPAPGTLDGEQVARIRLHARHAGVRFKGRVRESIQTALESCGLRVDALSYRILRSADEHDSERKEQRARRNIELADFELREVGPQTRLLNCLGEAFHALGEPQQAAVYYQHSIDRGVKGSPELLEAFYGLLTLEDSATGRAEVRMQTGLKALDAFPLDMQLLCAMGGYLQAAGRWDLAMRSYETAYRYGQIHPEVWHMDHLQGVAAECFALSLQLQGKLDEARSVLAEALAADPSCHRVRRQLLDMLVKHGQRDEALELVNREWPAAGREAMRSAVRGAALAAIQNWIAARAYLQVAYQAGCRETLCLRWLSITLMAAGATAEALSILTEWKKLEPNNLEPCRYLEALTATTAASGDASATSPADRHLRIDAHRTADGDSLAPRKLDIAPPVRPTIQR